MNKKLKAVIMASNKNGKVPAKVAETDPKAVDKLKEQGLVEQKTTPKGKPETVLTKAGEKAKAKAEAEAKKPEKPKAQEPEKASKKAPKKDEKAKAQDTKKASKKDEKTEKKTKVRKDTKQFKILQMLGRKTGATIQQLHEATGWKITTLRGTPGALKLKLGLEIESEKRDGKDTVYRITGGLDALDFV